MLSKESLSRYFEAANFFNRDLSWLEFNRRVLEEATNPNLPLLDRIKFISIFFSNLDEYYMIRVSGIKEQIAAKIIEPTIDGLTPLQELKKIELNVKEMLTRSGCRPPALLLLITYMNANADSPLELP